MAKISTKATNERRQQVWFLMLKGHNAQSMSKTLNVSQVTIYNDIKFLTKKSKQYVYDMAKGTHVLMFQRAVDGIGLALSNAWERFNDPTVAEKQKLGYLRLIKDCNESMIGLTTNGGPIEMAILQNLTERASKLGADNGNNIKQPTLTDEEREIQKYINHSIEAYPNDTDFELTE